MDLVLTLISQKLETANPDSIYSMRKTITTFFLFAAWQEQNMQHKALDVFLSTARISGLSGFMWHWIMPPIAGLLKKGSPLSLKQAALLASPHLPWWSFINGKQMIQLWAVATCEVPYTDEIVQSVVDTLLQIASNSCLQPHIPITMWSWLKKCPSLPPVCVGRHQGSALCIVQKVRAIGDIETLKSYMLLVWSEWDPLYSGKVRNYSGQHYSHPKSLHEMCTSIREDFSGIGMEHHQKDLLQHLDHILGQLDLGLKHLQQHKPSLDEDDIQQMREQYGKLKEVLLGK